jgi:hypothetical protein
VIWKSPGGQAYLERVVADLAQGKNAVLVAPRPRIAGGLLAALQDAMARRGLPPPIRYRVAPGSPGGDGDLERVIREATGLGRPGGTGRGFSGGGAGAGQGGGDAGPGGAGAGLGGGAAGRGQGGGGAGAGLGGGAAGRGQGGGGPGAGQGGGAAGRGPGGAGAGQGGGAEGRGQGGAGAGQGGGAEGRGPGGGSGGGAAQGRGLPGLYEDLARGGGLRFLALQGLGDLGRRAQEALAGGVSEWASATRQSAAAPWARGGLRLVLAVPPVFGEIRGDLFLPVHAFWASISRTDLDWAFDRHYGEHPSEDPAEYLHLKALCLALCGEDFALMERLVSRRPGTLRDACGIMQAGPRREASGLARARSADAAEPPALNQGRPPKRPSSVDELELWSEGLLSAVGNSRLHPSVLEYPVLEKAVAAAQRELFLPLVDYVHSLLVAAVERAWGAGVWQELEPDAEARADVLSEISPLAFFIKRKVGRNEAFTGHARETALSCAFSWRRIRHSTAHNRLAHLDLIREAVADYERFRRIVHDRLPSGGGPVFPDWYRLAPKAPAPAQPQATAPAHSTGQGQAHATVQSPPPAPAHATAPAHSTGQGQGQAHATVQAPPPAPAHATAPAHSTGQGQGQAHATAQAPPPAPAHAPAPAHVTGQGQAHATVQDPPPAPTHATGQGQAHATAQAPPQAHAPGHAQAPSQAQAHAAGQAPPPAHAQAPAQAQAPASGQAPAQAQAPSQAQAQAPGQDPSQDQHPGQAPAMAPAHPSSPRKA